MSAPRPFRLERRRHWHRTESRIVRVADGEPVTAWVDYEAARKFRASVL